MCSIDFVRLFLEVAIDFVNLTLSGLTSLFLEIANHQSVG